jgi:endonuclease/exonuclease/phosphatase (EEP) superfamily protein YafD
VTASLPPRPPPYQAPGAQAPIEAGSGVPARLARLADRHPLVIATVIVSLTVTWCTAGATVVAFAASWWWIFDILTSFRPQFALTLLVAVLSLAALRCWKTLPVALLALLLNVTQVAPVVMGHQPAARPGSATLTIAHLNLQSRVGDLVAIDRWLTSRPADVIVFLHTAEPTAVHFEQSHSGYQMIYPRLVAGNAAHPRDRFDPRSPEVIVLTDRHDVAATTPTAVGLPVAAVEIHTRLGTQPVTLLGLHTLSPGTAQRHSVRDSELSAVSRWLQVTPRPAVAFGDFNTTYYSPEMSALLHDSGARSSQIGFGIQATWPHQFRPAGIAIDQSVYTGALTAIRRHRGPNLGSEHRVLVVTYALAAG